MSDLRPLQEKAEKEFERFFNKYKENMDCGRGCSSCCISGLNVFAWEASIITDWFFDLSPEEKENWKRSQALPSRPASGSQGDKACAFLRQGECTIYEVRPSLCRTQGMALSYQQNEKVLRDWCPLNFKEEGSEPLENDDLNLDALNQMLAKAQFLYEQENPEALGPVRVDLEGLRDYLLSTCS